MSCPIRPMVGGGRRAGDLPPADPDPQFTDLNVQTRAIRLYLVRER